MNAPPLLSLEGVSVSYSTISGEIGAVSNVTLGIPEGVAIGFVGESGCGKTTLAKAIIRLLPPNGRIVAGRIYFDGKDLAALPDRELREIRGRDIAMVPQSAMNSLNPVYRVEAQLVETMVVRGGMGRKDARLRAKDLFQMVGINPARLQDYPHQFSGGMKQRATIALAMALTPRLIIADEPTTALDVLVEARILTLLQRLKEDHGLTLIYITHDLSVVSRTCGLMGVMYAGEFVEVGPTWNVVNEPRHPYTMGLIAAVPRGDDRRWNPVSIPGSPPLLLSPPPGCRFAERCPFAEKKCFDEHPALRPVGRTHLAACHFADRADEFLDRARLTDVWRLSLVAQQET